MRVFSSAQNVQWCFVFREKLMQDMDAALI